MTSSVTPGRGARSKSRGEYHRLRRNRRGRGPDQRTNGPSLRRITSGTCSALRARSGDTVAGVKDSRRRLECDHRAERATVIITELGYHARRLRVPGRWTGAPEFPSRSPGAPARGGAYAMREALADRREGGVEGSGVIEEQRIRVQGLPTRYLKAGEGRPLLLLHGVGAMPSTGSG